jgi:type IV secretion system protein VirD4
MTSARSHDGRSTGPVGTGEDLSTIVLTWVLLPVAALLGAVGGLVWVAGHLSATLTREELALPIDAAPELALQLAQRPEDVAAAFRLAGANGSPGPAWLFWTILVLLAVVLTVLGVLCVRRWLVHDRGGRCGTAGARWAGRTHESPLVVPQDPAERPGRLVAGRSVRTGRLLAGADCISAVGFGPNGSGKTTGLIAPNVAEWAGPVVMTTTKVADLALIHARRAHLGPVWVVAPAGAPGYSTAGWSPVAYASDAEAADRMAEWLVEASGLSSDPKSKPWLIQARKYVKPLLLAAHLSGRGIGAFTDWVYAGRDASDDVRDILLTHHQTHVWAEYQSTWSIHNEGIGSVLFTAYGIADAYARPTIRATADTAAEPGAETGAEQPTMFTADTLLASERPGTLVVLAAESDIDRLAPVFTALVSSVIHAAEQRAAARGGPLEPRLLLALDEAGTIFRYPRIANLLTTARGNGIQLLLVYHDLAQLEALFTPRIARTVLSNAKLRILLPGQGDLETLRYFSALLGQTRVRRASITRGERGQHSTSVADHAEELAPLHSLRELPAHLAVCQYQNLPATRVRLRFCHRDKHLRRLLASTAGPDREAS